LLLLETRRAYYETVLEILDGLGLDLDLVWIENGDRLGGVNLTRCALVLTLDSDWWLCVQSIAWTLAPKVLIEEDLGPGFLFGWDSVYDAVTDCGASRITLEDAIRRTLDYWLNVAMPRNGPFRPSGGLRASG